MPDTDNSIMITTTPLDRWIGPIPNTVRKGEDLPAWGGLEPTHWGEGGHPFDWDSGAHMRRDEQGWWVGLPDRPVLTAVYILRDAKTAGADLTAIEGVYNAERITADIPGCPSVEEVDIIHAALSRLGAAPISEKGVRRTAGHLRRALAAAINFSIEAAQAYDRKAKDCNDSGDVVRRSRKNKKT